VAACAANQAVSAAAKSLASCRASPRASCIRAASAGSPTSEVEENRTLLHRSSVLIRSYSCRAGGLSRSISSTRITSCSSLPICRSSAASGSASCSGLPRPDLIRSSSSPADLVVQRSAGVRKSRSAPAQSRPASSGHGCMSPVAGQVTRSTRGPPSAPGVPRGGAASTATPSSCSVIRKNARAVSRSRPRLSIMAPATAEPSPRSAARNRRSHTASSVGSSSHGHPGGRRPGRRTGRRA
jgi:hypothetical protein